MYPNIMYNVIKRNLPDDILSDGNLYNNTNNNNNFINNNNVTLYEPMETAKVYDDTSGGIFCDKFLLHVIPVEMNNNNKLFMNRISYNTQTNSYYENGILSNKYLKKWKEGVCKWNNIEKNIEIDWMKTYLTRIHTNKEMKKKDDDDEDKGKIMNEDGEISWKFDYRIGSYIIKSLNLKLSFNTFDNSSSIQWFIKPLPTMKEPDPIWQLIQFNTDHRYQVNEIIDVTKFVKNEYGFILKVRLSGNEGQLFRQDWNNLLFKDINVENDETFGLDVKVELKPDIIIDSLPQLFVSDDEPTSDFTIHYEYSTNNNDQSITSSNKIKNFRVYSKVLSKRSDYFNTLLIPKNKTLTLTDADIPYKTLKIILEYLYTGTFPEIESYDEWIILLRYASKFIIPTLVQKCEKALKGYLNHDNLSEVETIAQECGAEQLLRYCKNFNPPRNDY